MSEMVPKIRFQGFTDAWERRKLDDVLTERNIQQPQTSEYPLVSFTVEKGVTPKTERYEREQLVVGDTKSKKYKITEFNDIVYNPANLKFGAISRNSYGKAVFSPIYVTFVVDEQIAYPKFMEMFVTRPDFIQHALKYQQGTVYERQSVSPENLLSMNLLLPIKDEQSQIGLFFQKFDDIINFHQRKLDLLKEQKKGFLQKMFPKDGQIVPEIRFAGFTDDWEERKLNEVSDIYDGTHQTPKYQDNGVMFLSVENIKTLTSNKFISREAFEDEFKIRPQRGDVLMTRIGDIGTANVVETDEDLAYYVSLALFKSEELNPYFLQASIYAPFVQDQIWKRTLHIAFPKKINKNEIGQVPINVPTLAEQTKIGSFFKQIDATIDLHQRKLDLLKEQKKGFLQKMFPKNGAKVPELRFEGFTDDWEERKLGELSNIVGGGTPSTSNPEYWDGDIDWYAPAEIGEQSYVSKSKKTITELGLKKSSARILPVGTVLFTSRAGIGNTAILAKEATTNQGFQSIVPDQNKLDSYFIFSRTNELKRYGEVTGAGSTFVEVSGKQMSKMSIMVPELSEQQKIGSFFKQLDDTIALHQRKLDLLKEQKKGFLQKMFV